MTIRVKVSNEDSRETAVIAVQLTDADGKPITTTELKGGAPGESLENYVHSGQSLLVKEVRQ